MKHHYLTTDVLVIGGGIAGCNAAMAAAQNGVRVLVMEKAQIERSGDVGGGVDHFLAYLESGQPWDTREAFLDHIWDAGGGTGDPEIIDAACCSELKPAIERMARLGVPLTQPDGTFYRTASFGQPGPYFINFNGKKLKPALAREVRRLGCQVLDKTMALDLLLIDGEIAGGVGLQVRTGEMYFVQAKAVVIGTGDVTRLFPTPRMNPFNAWANPFNTGEGHAMAYRAGAMLANVEFMRTTITPKGFAAAGFNAFMGLGCRLVNAQGELFMKNYQFGGNPPRNAAVYCAQEEIRAGHGPLYLDCRHLSAADMKHLNSTLGYDKDTLPDYLEQRGVDLRTSLLEIDLSEGSLGGVSSVTGAGIAIDGNSAATIPGLFAAGNCADHCRGLWAATTGGFHAGRRAAEFVKAEKSPAPAVNGQEKGYQDIDMPLHSKSGLCYREIEDTLRKIMSEHAGSLRTAEGLASGLLKIEQLEAYLPDVKADDLHELMRLQETRSLIESGKLMIHAATYRRESRMRPFHFRVDFPDQDDANWHGQVQIRRGPNGPVTSFRRLARKSFSKEK